MSDPSSAFAIELRASAAHHRLVLTGELDLAAAHVLDAAVRESCDAGASQIDLDLRGVSFVDSVGLRALLSARDTAGERGVELGAIPNPALERIFEVTGLLDVLPWRNPEPLS